jgi:hypothetical protein
MSRLAIGIIILSKLVDLFERGKLTSCCATWDAFNRVADRYGIPFDTQMDILLGNLRAG